MRKKKSNEIPQTLKFAIVPDAKGIVDLQMPRWGDSGYDLMAMEATTLFRGEDNKVRTGIKIEIPMGYMGLIRDRSSLAVKQLSVHAGVIDSGYRGELVVIIENRGESNYQIERGQRIAQLLLLACNSTMVTKEVQENELSPTARGEGGFGSTGK